MRKFVKQLRSESGFTLIELIAALTIFTMVICMVSAVTIFGFRNYHKISIENALRDEADIVMSSIMTELYTFGPEYIKNIRNVDSTEDSRSGIILIKGDGESAIRRSIEIVDGRLVIGEVGAPAISNDPRTSDRFALSGSKIQSKTADGRSCESERFCNSGLIDISLQLSQADPNGRNYELTLESKFGF